MSLHKAVLRKFLIANILLFFVVISELFYNILFDKPTIFWKIALCCNFLFVITINFLLISRGLQSRYTSIYQKFQLLIDDIQHIMDSNCKGWLNIDNYPFVKIPFANSVNLQWTIRDNQLVNLPVALLVKGDSINLRPGQYIFSDCELDSGICEKGCYQKTYTIGQTFISVEETDNLKKETVNDKGNYRVIPMKSCATAVVTKTPIIDLIDEYLTIHSKKDAWPISVPERYIQFSVNALLIFVFVMFVINILMHVLWFILIGRNHNLQWSATTSGILLIGMPLHLPLLLFICLSNIMWKINFLRYKLDRKSDITPNHISMESIPSSISSSTTSTSSESINLTMIPIENSVRKFIGAHWNQIINQDYEFAKMIYSMGSLTSLCCVDKKGILADPITTPEKIFIYKKKHKHRSSSLINLEKMNSKSTQEKINSMKMSSNYNFDVSARISPPSTAGATITSLDRKVSRKYFRLFDLSGIPSLKPANSIPILDINCSLSVPVILDMTRSTTHPFFPSFNDNRWERYLSSLKPIGLNILLNNCNPEAADRYISFTDNMSVINFKNYNKSQLHHRCVCALATQIGFKSTATERFTLESTFAVCKKNARLFDKNDPSNNCVYSLPVGNVFSTVVKDSVQNKYQLMSQGSADLLMSMCSDYWDGKDIVPLTTYNRSKILEFYNRNIFSSYCIGFAYSPLFNKIKFNNLEDQCILQLFDVKGKMTNFNSKDSHVNKVYRGSLPSRNSFLKNARSNSKITEQTLLQSDEINSLLNHQIFLGMISFQVDQVQSDVIDCINRLEQACIRFVFFSKDNQLRSRVFAERLGMESGWNCHISLADPDDSDKTFAQNIRRNSSKSPKKFISEEVLRQSDSYHGIWYSEPILNAPSEPDQITHSTTLNEKNFHFIPFNEYPDISTGRLLGIQSKSFNDSSSLTSTSTKSRECYIDNPCDYFREDKSKLPCGIKSIRPHLENVDNVPLQVSLFTDCNTEVDHEMMSIMREYGEVICCCGSGLTVNNLSLFSSNDCAVAFVPLLHKQCWRQHEIKPIDIPVLSKSCQLNINSRISEDEPMLKNSFTVLDQKICFPELSPINIACRLVALPCGLLLNRKTGFNLISFITECHRLVINTLSCVAFYFLSCASFVLLKVLLNLVILIFYFYYGKIYLDLNIFPIDSQIIYHFYLHTPVLALVIYFRSTMLGKPLKEPPRKRGRLLTYKQCFRFAVASIGRFLPGIILCIVTLIWNLLILNSHQPIHDTTSNETGKVTLIPIVISDFLFIQHNIYIIMISLFYVNPEKPFWKFNCFKNLSWLIVVTILTSMQFMYFIISWRNQSNSNIYLETFKILHFTTLFSFCGILIVILFGFFSTYWENQALSVEHRLARLYFGTKLGMYSPV